MKTIGLIGGMSWESSLEYYRIINETVRDTVGGLLGSYVHHVGLPVGVEMGKGAHNQDFTRA